MRHTRGPLGTGDGGFTLIELLVVILVIGILAAIAIPAYLAQRAKAWDAQAMNDARNLAAHEESYAVESSSYLDFDSSASSPAEAFDGYRDTDRVVTKAKANGASGYCILSQSRSGRYFVYDSQAAGLDRLGKTVLPTSFPAGSACAVGTPSMP